MLCGVVCLAGEPAQAFENRENASGYAEAAPVEDQNIDHYEFNVRYDSIFNEKFEKDNHAALERNSFNFSEFDTTLDYIFFFTKKEAGMIGLEYSLDHFGWKDNPFFNEENFNNVYLRLGGMTKRWCNWVWKGAAVCDFDANNFNLWDSTIYSLTTEGRYAINDNFGWTIGFIAWSGIKTTCIYPIVGFDYKWGCNWKLNLVYPFNISLAYLFSDNWSMSVNYRIFYSRHRLGKKEPQPLGIIQYQDRGVELALNYFCSPYIEANIHAGGAFDGRLKLADRDNHRSTYYRFKTSPYVGASVHARF